MSPSAEIINAVQRARTSNDPGEIACGLICAAVNCLDDDDHIARVFLARQMVKIALTLDADAVLCPRTQ